MRSPGRSSELGAVLAAAVVFKGGVGAAAAAAVADRDQGSGTR